MVSVPSAVTGGVGQHALQVGLAQRKDGAHRGGQQPGPGQQVVPQRDLLVDRVQPRKQVDAELHHGGRVQVGADRRRRRHRVGQPEMEGELRRLGEAAEDHQQHGRHRGRMRQDRLARRDDTGKAGRAGGDRDEDEARQQREPAAAGDQQRLQRRLPRCRLLVVVGDEEEGSEARQLPEDEQGDDVVRRDGAKHRHHEDHQQHDQSAEPRVAPQVAPCIEQHERADSCDQQREHRGQPVEPQPARDAEGGHRPELGGGRPLRREQQVAEEGEPRRARPDLRGAREGQPGHQHRCSDADEEREQEGEVGCGHHRRAHFKARANLPHEQNQGFAPPPLDRSVKPGGRRRTPVFSGVNIRGGRPARRPASHFSAQVGVTLSPAPACRLDVTLPN
jgi:hypothetical protein